MVGIGVVDDVPGCEPRLAFADDLQALDIVYFGELTETVA
jgi:hypothetical protein